jgi:hypothetical protein
MHSIHDAAVVPKDDGVRGVHLSDQLGVLGDLADRGDLGTSVELVRRIDLVDRVDRHPLDRESSAQLDQAILARHRTGRPDGRVAIASPTGESDRRRDACFPRNSAARPDGA